MKTDKFEKTIRRKLNSITPEFHEDDWTKMQNYLHAHTPPTFWQQYSSWLGYAAAAAVTSVVALLYVHQLSQNDQLLSDVKHLKSQMEMIRNEPTPVQKTDTVYIVQKVYTERKVNSGSNFQQPWQDNVRESLADYSEENSEYRNRTDLSEKTDRPGLSEGRSTIASNNAPEAATGKNAPTSEIQRRAEGYGPTTGNGSGHAGIINEKMNDPAYNPDNKGMAYSTKTLDEKFDDLATQMPVQENNAQNISRRMGYALANRISPKQVKNTLLAGMAPKTPESEQHVASIKKGQTTIPKLNLKVPYRFGVSQQWEGNNLIRTALAEVVVSKNFSVSTGISWLKIKTKNYYSEKMYRDKTKKSFRENYEPKLMPFEGVENISVKPSVMQIPLTVAYRNDLKNDLTFFAGAGTNFTIKQEEEVAFDCYRDFYNPMNPKLTIIRSIRHEQVKEKTMHLPLVNSINISAGIEKSWHPLILQAEGYLYTYFTPLSPQTSRSGPGFKIKLLYQIGKKL